MELKWLNAFELTPETLIKWTADKPAQHSPLFWILRQKKISWAQHSSWAQKELKIPILQEAFFDGVPQEKIKTLIEKTTNLWNNEFMPVAIWDGVLYIVCLSPPDDLEINYSDLFKKLDGVTKHQIAIATPECLEKWWNKLPHTGKESSISKINFLQQTSTPEKVTTLKPPIDITRTFNVNFPPKPEDYTTTRALESDSLDIPNKDLSTIRSLSPDSATDWKEIGELIFPKMEKYYRQTMIMALDGHNLWPKSWNNQWNEPSLEEVTPTPLGTASIFEIVSKTQKPYHGPVFANPINNHFFSFWDSNKLAKYITIVPIIVHGQIEAMLIGTSDSEINSRRRLSAMENWGKEISTSLSPVTSILKAF